MNTFTRCIWRTFGTVLLPVFAVLFFACSPESDSGTYKVTFLLGGNPVEVVNVQKGYKIPASSAVIAGHIGKQGLYRGNAEVLNVFWTVWGGANDGAIWDFNAPVTEDMILTASNGTAPVNTIIAGRGKDFYDNAMAHVNYGPNKGTYVLLLGEDAGRAGNEAAGVLETAVNRVTFSAGVDLTIIGIGSERTIRASGSGLYVLPGDAVFPVSLTLGNNITVKGGEADNGFGWIRVGNNSNSAAVTFTMLEGSKVTGYTFEQPNAGSGGAAITVAGTNARFVMKGGKVTGNESTYTGGQTGSGVTLTRGTMIMEGNASITGNTGFGGDLAYGMNQNIYVELKDNATIGELYLYSNVTANHPYIRIHDGWTGSIGRLNLGKNENDFVVNDWKGMAFVRNAIPGGSITLFINRIRLGNAFRFNDGTVVEDGLGAYKIGDDGKLADKP